MSLVIGRIVTSSVLDSTCKHLKKTMLRSDFQCVICSEIIVYMVTNYCSVGLKDVRPNDGFAVQLHLGLSSASDDWRLLDYISFPYFRGILGLQRATV